MSFSSNMNSNSLVSTHISKLAQNSLREVKRLRIVLTRLLATVANTGEEDSDGTDAQLRECESGMKQVSKTNITSNSNFLLSDNKVTTGSPDRPCGQSNTTKRDILGENLQPHRLIAQIGKCLEALDESARYMRISRIRSCIGDLGLHNALSLITTLDQLEFSVPSMGHLGDESSSCAMRRADWLVDRWDAERWKNRYCERANTILDGLLACSMFQRSHLNLEQKRRKRDSLIDGSRDVRFKLECLLNDIHALLPKLTITLIESGSNIFVVHVKVAETMQCLVTFRQLHPAWIIVRGLTENCLISQTNKATSMPITQPEEPPDTDSISKPVEELLTSKVTLNIPAKETLFALLSSRQKGMRSDQDIRTHRAANPAYKLQPIQVSRLQINQLDLITPSRYTLFQRITSLAQCVLLHLSNEYQPGPAVQAFFGWLNSYHDLYTAPCVRCNQLLGQDVSLPLRRSYAQSRRSEQRLIEAQHEYCQAIP